MADLDDMLKLLLHGSKIKLGSKCAQSLIVNMDGCIEKTARRAVQDNADVEAFATLTMGNDTNAGVMIWAVLAHAGPPLQRCVNLPGDPASNSDKRLDEQRGLGSRDHPLTRIR